MELPLNVTSHKAMQLYLNSFENKQEGIQQQSSVWNITVTVFLFHHSRHNQRMTIHQEPCQFSMHPVMKKHSILLKISRVQFVSRFWHMHL